MPRIPKRRLHAIACSPAEAANQIGIGVHKVQRAIREGLLPCYQLGLKRRVLVVELIEWVRTWPKAEIRKCQRKILPT
jgi:excisionase family DNA binding protein